jgi:hypothetical protein
MDEQELPSLYLKAILIATTADENTRRLLLEFLSHAPQRSYQTTAAILGVFIENAHLQTFAFHMRENTSGAVRHIRFLDEHVVVSVVLGLLSLKWLTVVSVFGHV